MSLKTRFAQASSGYHAMNTGAYPGSLGQIILQEFTHAAKGALPQGYKRMLLNILLLGLFIGLPLIWTAMMGWVGIRISGGIDGFLKSAQGTATNAASNTSTKTKKIAKT